MIVLVIYLLGAVLAVWPLSQWLGSMWDSNDRELRIFDAAFACLLASVWPAVAAGVLAYRLSRRIWRAVIGDDQRAEAPSAER